MSIRPLPADVVTEIKSSTTLTTLNDVIEELIKNSLDAAANQVKITVQYSHGSCTIEDDGMGILPSEFDEDGGLGKMYHTSKLRNPVAVYGGQGCFLSMLSALALISITSHHHQYNSHNTMTMHRGTTVYRQSQGFEDGQLTDFNRGTRVSVRDLFGSMPVRVKQRAIISEQDSGHSREWAGLRRQLTHILLSWGKPISLKLVNQTTNQKLYLRTGEHILQLPSFSAQVELHRALLQAGYVQSDDHDSWRSVSASIPSISITGAISLVPHVSKSVQFLSIGIHPVLLAGGPSPLHDTINRLFSESDFGNEDNAEELQNETSNSRKRQSGNPTRGLPTNDNKQTRKALDRWPKFFIRIQPQQQQGEETKSRPLDYKSDSMQVILELLEATVLAFLTKYKFWSTTTHRSQPKRRKLLLGNKISSHSKAPACENNSDLVVPVSTAINMPPIPILECPDTQIPINIPERRSEFPATGSALPYDGSLMGRSHIRRGAGFASTLQKSTVAKPNRPSSAPPCIQSSSLRNLHERSDLQATRYMSLPLLSTKGKLLRKPFDDLLVPHSSSTQGDGFNISPRPTEPRKYVPASMGAVNEEEGSDNNRSQNSIHDDSFKTPAARANLSTDKLPKILPCRIPLINANAAKTIPSQRISSTLSSWDNPVYPPQELAIPQLSSTDTRQCNYDLFNAKSSLSLHFNAGSVEGKFTDPQIRITKDALAKSLIIAQLDKKFVLTKVPYSDALSLSSHYANTDELLVVVDQHAADERIRVENLLDEFTKAGEGQSLGIASVLLDDPIIFETLEAEANLLKLHKSHFSRWGVSVDVVNRTSNFRVDQGLHTQREQASRCVIILALPPGIQERCKQEPKVLIELIRSELWKVHESGRRLPIVNTESPHRKSWIDLIDTCPTGILDLLNSRACRSAIMFNDVLSYSQCEALVRNLARCKFPFQCAHGRPSLVPLGNLAQIDTFMGTDLSLGEADNFSSMYKLWK